ncbi:hypothetical protein RAM_12045 [Amycolatopsis mediterranei S699]|nr:hypothetical protein RAM_12045 [Amycolatopsis mediterranei S699]
MRSRPRKPIRMRIDGVREHRGFWITLATAELPTPENPAPLSVRYVWGCDPAAGELAADWYDSNGGRAVQRSAGWVGEELWFLGTITMNGATVPLRDTFTRRGPDAYHHVGEIDLGEGWIPVDEEEAVRATTPRRSRGNLNYC